MDFAKYMAYHNSRVFREEYQPKPFCYAIRRSDHSPEGVVALEATLNDGSKNAGMRLTLNARARQFSSFLVLVGRISGPGLFDPQYGVICQNKDEITIPLEIQTIPSAGEFKAATVSISPGQQAFAKMYRGMQLSSTLFGVCVIQIKPQLEKLLNLTEDALTKEIRLTQDLLELFIQYQIPSDLLSYGGGSEDKDARLEAVKRNVRSVQLLVESEKLKELLDSLDEAEKRAYEAIQQRGQFRYNDMMHSLSHSRSATSGSLEGGCPIVEGGRKGKISQAKKHIFDVKKSVAPSEAAPLSTIELNEPAVDKHGPEGGEAIASLLPSSTTNASVPSPISCPPPPSPSDSMAPALPRPLLLH